MTNFLTSLRYLSISSHKTSNFLSHKNNDFVAQILRYFHARPTAETLKPQGIATILSFSYKWYVELINFVRFVLSPIDSQEDISILLGVNLIKDFT